MRPHSHGESGGGPAVCLPSARMQLHFKAHQLADMDTFSKSDPYLVLFRLPGEGSLSSRKGLSTTAAAPVVEVGRTEVINNNLDPVWECTIVVDYFFEEKQEFSVQIFDHDGHKCDDKNDLISTHTFVLSHVVSARKSTREFPLEPRGSLTITAVEISGNTRDTMHLAFFGRALKKYNWLSNSDPYLKLYRRLPDGTRKLLHTTEVMKDTLSPEWRPLPPLPLHQLSGVDFDEECIEVECWDDELVSDNFMGLFATSVNGLSAALQQRRPFTLIKREKPGKQYGEIFVSAARVRHLPTFVEFLSGGWQVNLAISIDFTGSNGDPTNPRSLHHVNPAVPNEYERAIAGIGEIVMAYDSDRMVPVFGFGAVLPNGAVSHFFHVNMAENPYVHDVAGVLGAYARCLPQLRLAGPTNFAPTIRSVAEGARNAPGVYTILLIITDGEISDMEKTVDAIVAADDAPLSIIIVGVGNGCDFKMMDELDGDDVVLQSSSGRASRRDLVQFVPMRNFIHANQAALAAEVLREVPQQFTEWAELVGAVPSIS